MKAKGTRALAAARAAALALSVSAAGCASEQEACQERANDGAYAVFDGSGQFVTCCFAGDWKDRAECCEAISYSRWNGSSCESLPVPGPFVPPGLV